MGNLWASAPKPPAMMPKAPVRASKAPVRQAAAKRVAGKGPAPSHDHTPPSKAGHALDLTEMNPAQRLQYATHTVQQATKAELQPYQHQAGEIEGSAKATGDRFKGYGETSDKLLGGIQQGSEGSAKTFSNQAADAALKAQEGITGAGTQAQGANGGYLDPQVSAQLNLARGNVAGIGAAAGSAASTLGQNENNFMTNLRAAAGQRVVEGQGQIQGGFTKQLATNRGEQDRLIGKQQGAITNLDQSLQTKQFAQQAVEGKLQSEGVKLGIAKSKLGLEGKKAKADIAYKEGQLEGAKEGHELTAEKLGLEGKRLKADEWFKRQDAKYKTLTAQDKAKYDHYREQIDGIKAAKGSKLTQSQVNSYTTPIKAAFQIISEYRKVGANSAAIRQALTTGKAKQGGKAISIPKVPNQTLITAAFELYNLHKLTPQTVTALKNAGVEVPPELTNGQFKGF